MIRMKTSSVKINTIQATVFGLLPVASYLCDNLYHRTDRWNARLSEWRIVALWQMIEQRQQLARWYALGCCTWETFSDGLRVWSCTRPATNSADSARRDVTFLGSLGRFRVGLWLAFLITPRSLIVRQTGQKQSKHCKRKWWYTSEKERVTVWERLNYHLVRERPSYRARDWVILRKRGWVTITSY